MPASTRKRKTSEDDSATPEVVPPPKKTSRASQRQPSKAKASSSKKGGSGTRTLKGSKSAAASVSTAKRNIGRKADELLRLMEAQVKDEPATATEPKTPRRKDGTDLEHDSTNKGPNAIYQESCKHLQSLQDTIDEYRCLNDATANVTKPTETKQWEQDSRDITEVDKKAVEIVLDTLNGIVLGEQRADSHRLAAPSVDDMVEQAARRWLQTGIPMGEDTWRDTAREVLSALSGITKILS
ncbi:hypothetical protein ACQKWADRAFT_309455 [Trichoderma austrokoningii]